MEATESVFVHTFTICIACEHAHPSENRREVSFPRPFFSLFLSWDSLTFALDTLSKRVSLLAGYHMYTIHDDIFQWANNVVVPILCLVLLCPPFFASDSIIVFWRFVQCYSHNLRVGGMFHLLHIFCRYAAIPYGELLKVSRPLSSRSLQLTEFEELRASKRAGAVPNTLSACVPVLEGFRFPLKGGLHWRAAGARFSKLPVITGPVKLFVSHSRWEFQKFWQLYGKVIS